MSFPSASNCFELVRALSGYVPGTFAVAMIESEPNGNTSLWRADRNVFPRSESVSEPCGSSTESRWKEVVAETAQRGPNRRSACVFRAMSVIRSAPTSSARMPSSSNAPSRARPARPPYRARARLSGPSAASWKRARIS
jgi:hypothetical protein